MSYVSEVSSEEAPTVLIVDNNQMSIMRLKEVFRKRGFALVVCEDGDEAVDEYIRINPELVVMSLDIPSLDGHLAALEMREHGGDSEEQDEVDGLQGARTSRRAHLRVPALGPSG